MAATAPLLVLGAALAACGGSEDAAVTNVAEEFYSAVAEGDGAAACALLTPGTRSELEQSSGKECPAAILEEAPSTPGDGGVAEVFNTMAQVRWDGDTAFLARMPDGWRVLAVACEPRAVGPYDCKVKGG